MDPEMKACKDCRFDDYMTDECRRRAPKITITVNGKHKTAATSWPKVKPTDWCGEFEPLVDIQ